MATRVGTATGTNTATLPSHQAGDLIIVYAFRDGSTAAPTVPTGQNFQVIKRWVGSTAGSAIAFKYANSSSETVGTWTSATSLIAVVYRPDSGEYIFPGAYATQTGSSSTVTFPALTLFKTDNTSRVLGFVGHRSTNVAIDTAPSGMTNVTSVADATDEAAFHETTGTVTSWSAQTASLGGTASGYGAVSLELVTLSAAAPHIRSFSSANVGSSNGNVTVNKPSGTVEGDLLVCYVLTFTEATYGTPTISPPSGWTKEIERTGDKYYSGDTHGAIFWKFATASEPTTYTFTNAAGVRTFGNVMMVRVVGADSSAPFDVSNSTNTVAPASNIVFPSVTPTGNPRLLLAFGGIGNIPTGADDFPTSPPPTFALNAVVQNVTNFVYAGGASRIYDSTSATGTFSVLFNDLENLGQGFTLALKAAPASEPTYGALSSTLDSTSASSAGVVSNAASGVLAQTFDAASGNSGGAVSVQGFAAAPGSSAASAAGQVAVSGAMSVALADAAIGSAGQIAVSGVFGQAVGPTSITSTGGAPALSGILSGALVAATLAASAIAPIVGIGAGVGSTSLIALGGPAPLSGALSAELSPASLAAAGAVPISGQATVQGASSLFADGGAPALLGQLSTSFGPASLISAGSLSIAGATTGAGIVALAASGAVPVQGSALVTFAPLALTSGSQQVTGAALSSALEAATLVSGGAVPISGAITGDGITGLQSAAGVPPAGGVLSAAFQALAFSSAALVPVSGVATGQGSTGATSVGVLPIGGLALVAGLTGMEAVGRVAIAATLYAALDGSSLKSFSGAPVANAVRVYRIARELRLLSVPFEERLAFVRAELRRYSVQRR